MLGLIARKIGMSQVFDDNGNIVPVTIVKVEENVVVKKRLVEKDGYNALCLGAVDIKEKKISKPVKSQFADVIPFKKVLKEFKVDNPGEFEIGQKLGLEIFENIKFVDVVGTSKGKGFQGVMKRHGFGGGRKTHGSKFHRQNGSTGLSAYPSRVFKGLKRAGRMGADRVTVQNLKIYDIDNDNSLLIIKGCVPGKNKGIIYIKKAIKKK